MPQERTFKIAAQDEQDLIGLWATYSALMTWRLATAKGETLRARQRRESCDSLVPTRHATQAKLLFYK